MTEHETRAWPSAPARSGRPYRALRRRYALSHNNGTPGNHRPIQVLLLLPLYSTAAAATTAIATTAALTLQQGRIKARFINFNK